MDKRPARLSSAFDRSAGAPSPFPLPGGRWPADAPLHLPRMTRQAWRLLHHWPGLSP